MISENDFKNLAKLSRLDPEDKSLQGLMDDFNKILDAVEQIGQLHDSEALDHRPANENTNITRPDSPQKAFDTHVIGNFAPEWEAGHFVVPGVLDQEH